ncbi:platelet glycoprotein Ib alpha chain [Archocentrus centrarchus]|uniref:platelet glycoprotein Ib alpha chain n=1 Tax=Archocentrus centrarchus TaxID=63155 RepID=UPI0011EA18A3|nr:platelet glycoprotein Ib alpha chain-like [Archocentrus centrarchus]
MQLFLLLLLLLLSCVSTGAAVAGCLSDQDKDNRPRENCTAAGFSDIPEGIEPTKKVLLFPKNLFSSLSWSSFQVFAEIYEIDLTGNKVPAVTPSASPILPTLSVLRLGSNHLTTLSDGSFSACPYLTELYLENNAISSLRDHTFSGLTKLEILDLTSNHIRVLPDLMLHPLRAIETLFLENNKISVMPDNWFSQKEEVPYLYLSANPWACSCSLSYLRRYLEDYEFNVYVRDGPDIKADAESVVCDSPQQLKGTPVITLEESDLCSVPGPTGDFDQPATKYSTKYYYTTTAVPAPVPTATYSPPAYTALTQLYTMYDRVVTWSWSKTFTSLIEWSDYSNTEVATARFHKFITLPTVSTARRLTESQSIPAETTTSVPLTTPSTKPTLHTVRSTTAEATTAYEEVTTTKATTTGTTTEAATAYEAVTTTRATTTGTTTEATTTYKAATTTEANTTFDAVTTTGTAAAMSIPFRVASDVQQHEKVSSVRPAGVFCIWLFAGCLLLCLALAASILATVANMVIWYRRIYKPLCMKLAARRGTSEGMMLLTYNRVEGKEVGGGGVMALYRSVLFVHREAGEGMERENRDERGEGEGEERLLVALKPTGGGAIREDESEKSGREERGVYKKTLYRLLSREEEIEGWRDVMEECQVYKEDGSRRAVGQHRGMDRLSSRGGEGVSKKRYSVILREEREEVGGGKEELDWVVGGWEVKREGVETGEQPRSSWGEWLAHYLPSMPWGVTAPPEDEAVL